MGSWKLLELQELGARLLIATSHISKSTPSSECGGEWGLESQMGEPRLWETGDLREAIALRVLPHSKTDMETDSKQLAH